MTRKHSYPVGALPTHRVEALSDGVFAIVMTLLVFDIRLPEMAEVDAIGLSSALWQLRYSFIGYVVSFVLLGIYWLGHRNQFNYIRRADQTLHWLNILFFATSAFVPFSTGLLSRYPEQWLAQAIYGGNLIVIGLALYLHWGYAVHDYRLVDEDISPAVIRLGTQRCLLAPAGYSVAVLLGLLNPLFGLIVYAFVPLLYVLPHFHRLWSRFAGHSA